MDGGPAAAGQRLLHAGFLESAKRCPDAPALSIGERSWTYSELDQTARRWATAVLESVDPQRIGVFGHRSEVSYAGALASLFAGAAYVPLSPTIPARRTRAMLRSARLDALFADESALPQLKEVLAGVENPPSVFLPDTEASGEGPLDTPVRDRSDLKRSAPLDEIAPVPADSLAYLLFTSGSAGTPKGVPISHANVSHFLGVNRRRYGLTQGDRLIQTFDHVFDLSIFDLFLAWDGGACVLSPEPIELLSPFRFVMDREITMWFSVPSVAMLLRRKRLLEPGSLPTLRWSLFCGEALTQATAEAWLAAAPNSTLENLYGPTECTISCTVYRWNPERSPDDCVNGLVPIGQAYEGLHALVVDDGLAPVAPGEAGELCVAGPQTFAGYWRDPTAECFFTRADPTGAEHRYYRTGDRVVTLEGGDHAFLGRQDQQVQVLGHRVELGEIEGALRAEPSVTEAVALPRHPDAGTTDGIAAFVSGTDVDVEAVLQTARARLPTYMVPRTVRVLRGLPLNPNGKVDRAALQRRLEHER